MKKGYRYITTIVENDYLYLRPEDTPAYIWCVKTFGHEDNEYFRNYYAGWKYLGNGTYGFKSKYKNMIFKLRWL